MNGVKVSNERFKTMLAEKGITRYALAPQIGSTQYQMYRLASGGQTTSFRFLEKLVPVFGLSAVADIVDDEQQREAFTLWHIATHEPSRRAQSKRA
ncbi:helix-turn-helix domain-containing protein [Nonomuraea maritima]|uniref:helix-turn-helix domain-containing protein n=1 Tax=Nonomuraea maritima TaxID=683260 RepID=UPI00371C4A0F